jgi:hypothetical protein
MTGGAVNQASARHGHAMLPLDTAAQLPTLQAAANMPASWLSRQVGLKVALEVAQRST